MRPREAARPGWARDTTSAPAGCLAALGDRPGGEPRHPDREFSRAFDEAEGERGLRRKPGEARQGNEGGLLRAPAGGDREGGAARGEREAFEEDGFGDAGWHAHQIKR